VIQLILIVLAAALNVLQQQVPGGKPGQVIDLSAELLKIVRAGISAYELHKGERIDPALLKPIDLIL